VVGTWWTPATDAWKSNGGPRISGNTAIISVPERAAQPVRRGTRLVPNDRSMRPPTNWFRAMATEHGRDDKGAPGGPGLTALT
jgi:hypothetical protein